MGGPVRVLQYALIMLSHYSQRKKLRGTKRTKRTMQTMLVYHARIMRELLTQERKNQSQERTRTERTKQRTERTLRVWHLTSQNIFKVWSSVRLCNWKAGRHTIRIDEYRHRVAYAIDIHVVHTFLMILSKTLNPKMTANT